MFSRKQFTNEYHFIRNQYTNLARQARFVHEKNSRSLLFHCVQRVFNYIYIYLYYHVLPTPVVPAILYFLHARVQIVVRMDLGTAGAGAGAGAAVVKGGSIGIVRFSFGSWIGVFRLLLRGLRCCYGWTSSSTPREGEQQSRGRCVVGTYSHQIRWQLVLKPIYPNRSQRDRQDGQRNRVEHEGIKPHSLDAAGIRQDVQIKRNSPEAYSDRWTSVRRVLWVRLSLFV